MMIVLTLRSNVLHLLAAGLFIFICRRYSTITGLQFFLFSDVLIPLIQKSLVGYAENNL